MTTTPGWLQPATAALGGERRDAAALRGRIGAVTGRVIMLQAQPVTPAGAAPWRPPPPPWPDEGRLRPFEWMEDDEMIDHLVVMHGMPSWRAAALRAVPGFLRGTLIILHGIRHDEDATVPHKHGRALTISRDEGDDGQ